MFFNKSSLALVVIAFAVVYGTGLKKTQRVSGGKVINALSLVVNGTVVRDDYVDTFNCKDLGYGYYADVDNRCEVFHVCLPVTNANNKIEVFRWSFVCPAGYIFDQEIFSCVDPEDAILCEDSPIFYHLTEDYFMDVQYYEEGQLIQRNRGIGNKNKPRPVGAKKPSKYRPDLAPELASQQPSSLTLNKAKTYKN